jgi:hypothetical protein
MHYYFGFRIKHSSEMCVKSLLLIVKIVKPFDC